MQTNSERFEQAFERIKAVTGAKTQLDVGEILGIRQSSISDAKRRGAIPAGWQVIMLKRYGVNPEWLDTGEGPMYLAPSDGFRLATISTDALLAELAVRVHRAVQPSNRGEDHE